jgi:hypothetical protein
MSNLPKDLQAFKESCSVVFQTPAGQDVYSCGICFAFIGSLYDHWNWHYDHWTIHMMFPWHSHSTGSRPDGLPDNPVALDIFNTFG